MSKGSVALRPPTSKTVAEDPLHELGRAGTAAEVLLLRLTSLEGDARRRRALQALEALGPIVRLATDVRDGLRRASGVGEG